MVSTNNKADTLSWRGVSSRYFAPSIADFDEISPKGRRMDASRFPQGLGAPSENPRQNREAQDLGGMSARFFFGFSLLVENCSCIFGIRYIPVACETQEKTRLSFREPTTINRRDNDTHKMPELHRGNARLKLKQLR